MAQLVVKEEELQDKLLEACRLLIKMRYYRRRWELNHDAATLKTVKEWEARADNFLGGLDIQEEVQEIKQGIKNE